MLSELEYYKKVAYDAVDALRFAYWQDALRKRINESELYKLDAKMLESFYEDCDDEAEEQTIDAYDLSPYQFADFMGYENVEPYDDYCALESCYEESEAK